MIDTESRKSMMPGSTGVTSKSAGSGDGNVPDKFPAGLRVLVVDDDPTCLMILAMMLRKCDYEVTKSNRAEVALSLLRENKNGFDVVISDVHMPDMDGFKLLVHIGLEMDLPVIMMSADDSKSVVMKGVTHGACDYLIKPVRIEALRNIWQHVVRKRKHEWKDLEPSASLDDGDRQQKQPEDPEYSSFASEGNDCKNIKRRKGEEDEAEEKDDSSSSKKPRIAWTHELHQHFVAAINHLGINKAVPKKILDLMNVPGLTRENVASHLQKFRQYLKKLEAQQSGGMNTSFRDNLDAGYGSFSELDLHSLAAIGQVNQLSAQSHATLRATALGRSGNLKSSVSVPLVDQTNMFFSFDNPKLRYGNQHENNSNISRQMNFLHGIPTTMEQKQLSGLQRSFTGMHNSQAHDLALRQPVLPILAASQASSLLDIPGNHITELTGNDFSPRGNVEATSSTQGFVSSYGLLKNVNQNTTHDWGLQSVDLTFDPSQNRNNMQGGLNVLQHNYALGRKKLGSMATLSVGEGSGSHIADNPSRTMAESVDYNEDHGHDDFLTAIFTQAEAENEYAYSWYSLDNLRA